MHIQKLQIETMIQPRQRFSSVGIFPCIMRQKLKECEGGMQYFHIEAAHGNEMAADIRKLKACFEVNLPLEE